MCETEKLQLGERFFIHSEAAENAVVTLSLTELSQPANAEHLLITYASMLGTDDKRLAAAIFCSWYAGICGAKYALLTASPPMARALCLSNMSVQLIRTEGFPIFSFPVHENRDDLCQKHSSGEELLDELGLFYKNDVRPIILALAEAAQTKAVMLWKHIYNQLYTYMEEEARDAAGESQRNLIIEQFKSVTWELEPEVFGLPVNPFRIMPKFRTDPNPPHRIISIKATCCLAYQLRADHGYCSSCPILPPEQPEITN
ncbi:(2Fe-2S)-binding protein [Paenibacillus sp. FSL L8-0470]|uniref:(2Fe-2S)-binding protein n=1 Tax=unclassified Paenibacillus TaxID=185978 RepID=UPI0030FAFD86